MRRLHVLTTADSVGSVWTYALELASALSPLGVAGPMQGSVGNDRSLRGIHQLGDLPSRTFAAWASRASIFALPARYEPFGRSVVEAALAGCALVLGDVESLREVWGDTAIYVKPGLPDALALALSGLIRDPLRRRSLASASRARALALTPARMAHAYRALYDELVDHAQHISS